MNRLSLKSVIFVIIFVSAGLFFVFDPFDWWSIKDLVGKPCPPMSLYPRCTGNINFF